MEIHTLWPLSQREIEGTSGSFVDTLFSSKPITTHLSASKQDVSNRLLIGGYPVPVQRSTPSRRRAWFGSYLTTILQRDVREMAQIEGIAALPRLLSLLAARTAGMFNQADLSRDSKLPYTTLTRYLPLLEATFLIRFLPAWSSNLGLRFVKSPKLLINDTGLAASLLGLDAARLDADGRLFGSLLENFVAMEMAKDIGWSETQPQLFHFRTHARQEVDLVLEDASGRIVAIEVKSSATVMSSDFSAIRTLADATGANFVSGVVIHLGDQVIPFAANLHAVPVSALWHA